MASTACGRPSITLFIRVAGTPAVCNAAVVPPVARMEKPSSTRLRQISIKAGLSSSLIEINTVPDRGKSVPAPSWLFANARPKSVSMPITSPVDFISGPKNTSTPGKRAKGNTASFTATCGKWRSVRLKLASFSPAMTREAILANGTPVVFATKGTVRLPRGFTSSK